MRLIVLQESFEVADRAVRSELLSMERLLVHTVYVRSLARLNEIKTELQLVLKDVECEFPRVSRFRRYKL